MIRFFPPTRREAQKIARNLQEANIPYQDEQTGHILVTETEPDPYQRIILDALQREYVHCVSCRG